MEKKKLLFLINPHYGTESEMSSIHTNKEGKSGIAFISVQRLMERHKVGGRRNLYIQFLYRIYLIHKLFNADLAIGLFSPSAIFNNDMGRDIRDILENKASIKDSFLLKASNFLDVAETWGISFSIWNGRNKHNYNVNILGLDNGYNIISIGTHLLKPISKNLMRSIQGITLIHGMQAGIR